MDKEMLNEILKKHEKWLAGESYGEQADLSNKVLNGIDLSYEILDKADLSNSYLRDSSLSYLNLRIANLSGTDFHRSNLLDADLTGADLHGADLRYANLCGANLSGADLRDVKYNERTAFFALQCPEEGSFIGYKKTRDITNVHDIIVKLEICADAKRSSATTRKCRCSAAKVLSLTYCDGTQYEYDSVRSTFDYGFVYKVGEVVSVDDFDDDRWNECSTGIHFFITRQEAVNY